jgi:hypothetical protein
MTVQCYAGALRRFFTYVEDVDRTFHLGAIFDLTTERQMILSATHVTEFQQQHPGSAALQLDKAMKQFLMFLAKFRLESSNTAEEARLDRVEKMEGHIRETLQQSKRGQDKASARTKRSNDAGKHDRDHLSCRPDAVQNMLRKLIQCPTLSQEINISSCGAPNRSSHESSPRPPCETCAWACYSRQPGVSAVMPFSM